MITRRGKIVRAVLIGLGIAFLWWAIGNIWWTGEGYCVGSMVECFK